MRSRERFRWAGLRSLWKVPGILPRLRALSSSPALRKNRNFVCRRGDWLSGGLGAARNWRHKSETWKSLVEPGEFFHLHFPLVNIVPIEMLEPAMPLHVWSSALKRQARVSGTFKRCGFVQLTRMLPIRFVRSATRRRLMMSLRGNGHMESAKSATTDINYSHKVQVRRSPFTFRSARLFVRRMSVETDDTKNVHKMRNYELRKIRL